MVTVWLSELPSLFKLVSSIGLENAQYGPVLVKSVTSLPEDVTTSSFKVTERILIKDSKVVPIVNSLRISYSPNIWVPAGWIKFLTIVL